MKTTVKDYFTQTSGNVNNAISFIHNGDVKKTFVSLDDLQNYNDIDSYRCVFGAQTSVSFQYSMILEVNDVETLYKKTCTRKNGYTSDITCIENSITKLYSLASYGFKVIKKSDNTFVVFSPYYKKLTAFRRIADGIENYFNIKYIDVNRYDNMTLQETIKINHNDIIKEVQKTNRGFTYRLISNRLDKNWN